MREFELVLALLFASSVASAAWHASNTNAQVSDVLLRALAWTDMSVAPALLAFAARRYPGRWTVRALGIAVGMAGFVLLTAISGAANRVLFQPVPHPSAIDLIAALTAVLLTLSSYFLTTAYLVYSYRRSRDPFERNRLLLITSATVLIIVGQLTNFTPIQRFPVDRSLALVSSALIFISLVRYRLFDLDVALRRAALTVIAWSIVAPLYLGALFTVGSASGGMLNWTLFVVGVVLVVPAVLLVHLVRLRLHWVVQRVFVGVEARRPAAAADFSTQAHRIRDPRALAAFIGSVCQRGLAARLVTVLIADASGRLVTASSQGPFSDPLTTISIRPDNEFLRRLAQGGVAVMHATSEDAREGVSAEDLAEFAGLGDCVLQPIATPEILGLIAVADHVYDDPYSIADLDLLEVIGSQAALAIENARLFEQVQQHAYSDYLTGLPNHRSLQDMLDAAQHDAAATESPFAVAMVDVDNFKLLNDTYGHIAGDEALRRIAEFLSGAVRDGDIVGRYGGDEFTLIMPNTTRAEGTALLAQIARRARHVSLSMHAQEQGDRPVPIRLSWGVGCYPDDGSTPRMIVAAADSDLLKRRYTRHKAGDVRTDRSLLRKLSERDPRRIRIASALIDLLDLKDPYTSEHSQQVAALGLLLAEELQLSDVEGQDLWLGGLLHDIGKLNVPADIIRKPGDLSDSEWSVIHQHPLDGERLFWGLFGEGPLSEIVGSHHERFDGGGYPRALVGEQIPMLARAVAVIDAYSAMVHDRPYRRGLALDEAVAELRRGAGSQWDPRMVEAFVAAITREGAGRNAQPRAAA